ncbi:hypothetical protein PHYBOEH_002205 [Phytophthora boehmeriae]|uniref:ABC transporter domain-containing protein n=1 Tax=Phytophthora boehmeriae TaxID=109152 RepID=A0A8T1WW81_9STRA|nr:hypothetical protein PHYBOEH_002205 [Phytophthora boehmeriae]
MRIAPQPFHGAGVYGTPTQAFRYAPFFDKIALVFPIGFVLSYLYTVSRITVSFLMEKETRSRELMRIIGARDSELFGGWVLAYLPILVLATVLQAVGAHVMLFPSSDAKLLFIFFFTFATSSFGYGYLISTVFSRARAGSLVGMAIFFMMFFVSFSFNEGTSVAKRTVAALLPPISLSQGISVVAELESFGVGVNRDNAYELIKNFRFANAIGMQVLDTLLYILLGKYCEKVVPQEFGVAEKWYFFLMKKFWFPQTSQLVPTEAQINEETGNMVANSDAVEPVRYDLKQQEKNDRAVSIAGLRKEFAVHGGTKIAVHGLHLKFYEGEITCLLGHNGAGKTTVISMLTGMTPPTSGDAWVRGHSVVTGMRLIRRSLGYCPQHSVLYPTLTVKEHLLFYGRIKGFTNNKDLATEVTNKINEVGLAEKRDVSANALSGGMQRKLSLAIAFLGDSTVVFLDEPTAGMDPYSRRSTWELIQKNRVGRVVILTTHFMDEADILGDRIAIMAEGKLQCVGSSLFLKNRFGVGYRLCLMRQNGTHSQAIITLVQQYVPQAIVASDIGTELTFQLPFQASDGFPALFRDLEIRQYELNILSFAISVTTLEEIFLKVAESGSGKLSLNGETESAKDAKCDESRITQPRETVIAVKPQSKINTEYHGVERGLFTSPHVSKAFMNQMSALLRKRVLCGKRDFNMVFFSTILPVVAIFIGLSALKLSTILVDDPKLELSPSALFPLAEQTPVPFCCPSSFDVMSGGDGKPAWCSDVVQGIDGAVYELDLENVVYNGSATPTVFGVAYSSPSIDSNDTSGYNLRFGELVFEKGYGYADGAELNAPLTQNPMEGQYGGYIFYASETTHTLSYNVLANGSSTHAAPTYKHMIDSAIHRFLLSKASTSAKPNVTIRVSSHPLPLSFTTRSIFSSYLSFPAVICVVIGFTFIPASMMPFLVKEKQLEQNAKYQQLLSGMPFFAYWLSNFVFDVALYLVPMVATLLLLRGYGVTSSFSGADSCDSCTQDVPGATVALFVLFGTAIAPWTYLLSHVMKQPGECLLYTVMINFFVGLLLLLLSFTMDTLDSTRAANSVLVYIWRISPLFSLGDGLLKVLLADLLALFGLTTGSRSAFDADIAGTDIWYLLLECPLFILLTVGYDTFHGGTGRWRIAQFWTKLNMTQRAYKPAPCNDAKLHIQKPLGGEGIDEEIDGDVATEAQRVFDNAQTRNITSEVVQILKLEKVYANGKRAVKSLSFGLQQGECFGFLGVNGAGKTTTMKVLTGDLLPSSGTAMINGFDICKERSSARKSIGYCPQFDALIDLLTVREHLELFGRLKGFRSSGSLKKEVDRLLNKLQIQVFAGKLAGSLSGGNKRKLSLAIAMIGDPTVLVLDEPSTGVDPFSRRLLWDVILEASVQSRRSTVMLTTHSMEECEALCSKAGIMVDGGLRCFGSIPHLKARFGDGFMVEFKLETPNSKKVAELSLQVCDHLKAPDTAHFASAQLESVCAALGNGDRASSELITCLLTQQGRGGDIVDVASFCDWWLLEDRVQRLDEFLQAKFSGVMLLERQTDFCRYKVAGTIPSTQVESDSTSQNQVAYALSSMFELVEGAKSALGIKEYSLSQTSLEQIFNSFAHRRAGTELPH